MGRAAHESAEERAANSADRLAEALEVQQGELEALHAEALSAESAKLRAELDAVRLAEVEGRLAQLEALAVQVRAFDRVFDGNNSAERFSHLVHKLSSATMALSSRADGAAPLTAEVKLLRKAGSGDSIVELAVASLPERVVSGGALTAAQLRHRFDDVRDAATAAALAPDDTMLGHAAGAFFSSIMLKPRGVLQGDDVDAVLSRVAFALDGGDLEKAVAEMGGLSGLAQEAAADWMEAAQDRIALNQALTLVKTHSALLAASLR